MLDKDTYYLKKTKVIMLHIFNMVLKAEELALKDMASQENLSVAEMHTLVAVGRHHAKTISEIARELLVNVSTLSISVNKLQKKGYVQRLHMDEDRRLVRIALTDQGREALAHHEEFYFNLVKGAVGDLTEPEKKLLIQSLENLQTFFEQKIESHLK